jgi:hypothetical protein
MMVPGNRPSLELILLCSSVGEGGRHGLCRNNNCQCFKSGWNRTWMQLIRSEVGELFISWEAASFALRNVSQRCRNFSEILEKTGNVVPGSSPKIASSNPKRSYFSVQPGEFRGLPLSQTPLNGEACSERGFASSRISSRGVAAVNFCRPGDAPAVNRGRSSPIYPFSQNAGSVCAVHQP